MADKGECAGYFVPECEWAELEDTKLALDAVTEIAGGPVRTVQLRSDQLGSLLRIFGLQIGRAQGSAKFVA